MCRSVPHSPTVFTRISTSLGPIAGTGICCSVKPGAARTLRSARIVSGIPVVVAGRSAAVEVIATGLRSRKTAFRLLQPCIAPRNAILAVARSPRNRHVAERRKQQEVVDDLDAAREHERQPQPGELKGDAGQEGRDGRRGGANGSRHAGRSRAIVRRNERERVGLARGHVHLRKREPRSEEHTSELQSRQYLVCRLLLEKKKT